MGGLEIALVAACCVCGLLIGIIAGVLIGAAAVCKATL